MQEPQILDKPALTVIGMHRSFLHALSPESNTKQVIGGLWHEFPQRASSVPHRAGHTMYGIIYGLPEEERSHPHQLEYIAAVPVSSTAQIPDGMIPDGMVARAVPAAKFAVFLHRGPIEKIRATVYDIYRVWLPASPYVHAEIADVELYDHRFCPESGFFGFLQRATLS
jgi:AraC family transcriptional regulator